MTKKQKIKKQFIVGQNDVDETKQIKNSDDYKTTLMEGTGERLN